MGKRKSNRPRPSRRGEARQHRNEYEDPDKVPYRLISTSAPLTVPSKKEKKRNRYTTPELEPAAED